MKWNALVFVDVQVMATPQTQAEEEDTILNCIVGSCLPWTSHVDKFRSNLPYFSCKFFIRTYSITYF
eukprot:2197804-Ditylum_brightwellii.AAC.1